MKTVLTIIAGVALMGFGLTIIFTKIPTASEATARDLETRPEAMFEMVDDGLDYEVFRHKETGCHYIYTGSSYGSFTAMVTPTGKPFCN